MAQILFSADFEEGNIFASFGLAKRLTARGHRIAFLGVPDARPLVVAEGFEFISLLQSIYPEGSKYSTGISMSITESRNALCRLLTANETPLTNLMSTWGPALIVVQPYLAVESLMMQLRYGVQPVHLRSAYVVESREEALARSCTEIFGALSLGEEVRSFLHQYGIDVHEPDDLIGELAKIPEVVTLPDGYEPTATPPRANTYFIGGTVDVSRQEDAFNWPVIPADRKILYCTLGSQSHRDRDRTHQFLQAILDAVDGVENWFLLMAVGKGNAQIRLRVPDNARVIDWAPQLTVLSRADMMIMHGGMGTTRECISLCVPMLVHPLMRDQFASAEAICRHGLGVALYDDNPIREAVRSAIESILADTTIRANLVTMKHKFELSDQSGLGVRVIEDLLSKQS